MAATRPLNYMLTMSLSHWVVTLTALVGCAHDVRHGRIPNYLTFGSALLALVYALAIGGWASLAAILACWLIGFGLFVPFFLLRGMGGGDVKLLAALGAWLGPLGMLSLAFYTALAGGAMALVVVLSRGYFMTTLRNLWLLLCHWRVVGPKSLPEISLENQRAPRLAYGLAIAVGAITTIWLQ